MSANFEKGEGQIESSADKNTFDGREIGQEERSKLNKAKKFRRKEGSEEFEEKIHKEKDGCKSAQNKLNVGIICLLTSTAASDYVDEQSNFAEGTTGIGETIIPEGEPNFTDPLTIAVSKTVASKVVRKCMNSLKSVCLVDGVNETVDDLEN